MPEPDELDEGDEKASIVSLSISQSRQKVGGKELHRFVLFCGVGLQADLYWLRIVTLQLLLLLETKHLR
jgi:hypothetical protein